MNAITDTAVVLEHAADLIDARGLHHDGSFEPQDGVGTAPKPGGRLGANGALGMAAYGEPVISQSLAERHPRIRPAMRALVHYAEPQASRHLDVRGMRGVLHRWSNRSTAEQVADAMRAAARQIREGGAS